MAFAVRATLPDIFHALSEPTRWMIVGEMSRVNELACSTLEDILPVSRSTISYHVGVLVHAGLVEVRKHGRHYFYALRRETLDDVLTELAGQASPSLTS
jgi:DNA-binding transcriptional ArsR family regulator